MFAGWPGWTILCLVVSMRKLIFYAAASLQISELCLIAESERMKFEVLENVNLICVRCSICVIFFAFIAARSAEFTQEPVDVAMARDYPLLGLSFPTISLVQCATECLSNPFCAMFIYSFALGKCALFGVSNQTATAYVYAGLSQYQAYVYNSDCRYMYVRALNSCWKITTDAVKMSPARSTCQNLGGDLIQVRSMEEFNFLQGVLLSTSTWSSQAYWVGASNSSKDFTWLDTNLVIDAAMWAADQPDHFGSDAENCVNLMPIFNFSMNDINCGEPGSVVCSIPAI